MAAFFVAWIVLQLSVPVVQLLDERPARFGWQMYSAVSAPPLFLVETTPELHDTVDVGRYAITMRGEIDWDSVFPPHLCRTITEAAAVVAIAPDRTSARRVPCR